LIVFVTCEQATPDQQSNEHGGNCSPSEQQVKDGPRERRFHRIHGNLPLDPIRVFAMRVERQTWVNWIFWAEYSTKNLSFNCFAFEKALGLRCDSI
jgi:hypothetical protein